MSMVGESIRKSTFSLPRRLSSAGAASALSLHLIGAPVFGSHHECEGRRSLEVVAWLFLALVSIPATLLLTRPVRHRDLVAGLSASALCFVLAAAGCFAALDTWLKQIR